MKENSSGSKEVGIEELNRIGYLASADVHFGKFCAAPESGRTGELVLLAAALASKFLRDGHPCVPLRVLGGMGISEELREGFVECGFLPSQADFEQALRQAKCVSRATKVVRTPLVLDEAGRLYLARYYLHEQHLAQRLTSFAGRQSETKEQELAVAEFVEARLAHYFPEGDDGAGASGPDLQKHAARVVLARRFAVISGGPGTGKTSTMVKILALLVEQAEQRARLGMGTGKSPQILLLAPTGKAAARMMEAIGAALSTLDLPDTVRARLALGKSLSVAQTIHRALGVIPNNPTRFRRTAKSPLRADVVLVDEASMVDLSLMRALGDALSPHTRLILLGDRHQLASVAAGSVLSELCDSIFCAPEKAESRELGGALVELQKSYRFQAQSGIARFAQCVREGDARGSVEVLRAGSSDLIWFNEEEDARLKEAVLRHYGTALGQESPSKALSELTKFSVLCAHRKGRFGVEGQNAQIRAWLVEAGVVPELGEYYRGQLLLITENDYGVGLANGDVGVVWPDEEGQLLAHFRGQEGALRSLSPAQLPAHEPAFALTIHKSQGSEHEHVAVVLPAAHSKLLTRELLYTAVTRAKKTVQVFASEEAIRAAVSASVVRHSGLADAIAHMQRGN